MTGADLADGSFLTIDQNAKVADIPAPQDKEIALLGEQLNKTYIAYGKRGFEGAERQKAQDATLTALSTPLIPIDDETVRYRHQLSIDPGARGVELVDVACRLGQPTPAEMPAPVRQCGLWRLTSDGVSGEPFEQ